MNLKFKLLNGEIFEFNEYNGYSEFIDNLEPKENEIINVLESFITEDFEIAYIEYKKYVGFKDAIKQIINNGNVIKKEDFIELSRYELKNPILDWLMINDTTEEKEIKEMASLDSLKLKDIEKDNILFYYLFNTNDMDKFRLSCRKGHIKVAKWLYNFDNEKRIDIHKDNDMSFSNACLEGHLDIAKWLYSLGGVNIHLKSEYIFKWSCGLGRLEVAKWLYSHGGINIHIDSEYAFWAACGRGHLEVARWLYSLGDINIHNNPKPTFEFVCENGHLEVAQWLYDIDPIMIMFLYGRNAFNVACLYGRLEIVKWLYSFGNFSKNEINSPYKTIKDWVSTLD